MVKRSQEDQDVNLELAEPRLNRVIDRILKKLKLAAAFGDGKIEFRDLEIRERIALVQLGIVRVSNLDRKKLREEWEEAGP